MPAGCNVWRLLSSRSVWRLPSSRSERSLESGWEAYCVCARTRTGIRVSIFKMLINSYQPMNIQIDIKYDDISDFVNKNQVWTRINRYTSIHQQESSVTKTHRISYFWGIRNSEMSTSMITEMNSGFWSCADQSPAAELLNVEDL